MAVLSRTALNDSETFDLFTSSEVLTILRSMSDEQWATTCEISAATFLPLTRVADVLELLAKYHLVHAKHEQWLIDAAVVVEHCRRLQITDIRPQR